MQRSTLIRRKQFKWVSGQVRLKQGLHQLTAGQSVFMVATDPGSEKDVQAFIQQTPHQLKFAKEEGLFQFWVRKE